MASLSVRTKISQDYELCSQKRLGEGQFGTVFYGFSKRRNQTVAIKKLKVNSSLEWNMNPNIKREVEVLVKVNHPNILKLLDVVVNLNAVYIIFEFCEGGDLRNLLKRTIDQRKEAGHANLIRGGLSELKTLRYFYEMVQGMAEINRHGIIHRDLKPENVMIDNQDRVKIADFGLAREIIGNDIYKLEEYTTAGTFIYMAPQVINKQKYSGLCDIWSCGLLVYQLLTGTRFFREQTMSNLRKEQKELISRQLKIPEGFDEIFHQLLPKMISYHESGRISFQELEDYLRQHYAKGAKRIKNRTMKEVSRYLDTIFAGARAWIELAQEVSEMGIDSCRKNTLAFLQTGLFVSTANWIINYANRHLLILPSGSILDKGELEPKDLDAEKVDSFASKIKAYCQKVEDKRNSLQATISALQKKLLSEKYRANFPELYRNYPQIYERLEKGVPASTWPLKQFEEQYRKFLDKEIRSMNMSKLSDDALQTCWKCVTIPSISTLLETKYLEGTGRTEQRPTPSREAVLRDLITTN